MAPARSLRYPLLIAYSSGFGVRETDPRTIVGDGGSRELELGFADERPGESMGVGMAPRVHGSRQCRCKHSESISRVPAEPERGFAARCGESLSDPRTLNRRRVCQNDPQGWGEVTPATKNVSVL
jgi:hypothetical protein